jgi:excinuclease ABC subunit C
MIAPSKQFSSLRRVGSAETLPDAVARAHQLAFEVGTADGDVARLREQVRASARNVPGVYLMRGAHGEVLYVGKSARLRTRVLSYFRLP